MSYENGKDIRLSQSQGVFSGGYVDNTSSLYLENHRSKYLRNCRIDGQSIMRRPGHILLSSLTAGDYPRGIGTYHRTTSSNDRLIVRHNTDATHKLYSIESDGTATSILTNSDIASNNRMNFLNVGDVIYCMNGSDDLGKWDGTTYTTPISSYTEVIVYTLTDPNKGFKDDETITGGTSGNTAKIKHGINGGGIVYDRSGPFTVGETLTGGTSTNTAIYSDIGPFTPSFGVYFSSKVRVSGTVAGNIVFASSGVNQENFVGLGSGAFSFEEQVRGLSENDKTLLVFTQNTISTVDLGDLDNTNGIYSYNTAKLQTQEGTKYHNSIVTVGMNTYFLSSSNKLLRVLRGANNQGFEILELSDRKYSGITELMSTLAEDQSSSFGYFLQDKNIIKWFLKTDGSSFNDLCIVYDIVKDVFLVDEQKYFYGGVFFNNRNYTISNIEPKVYRDEYGVNDESTKISMEYQTKKFYITDPFLKKIFWETFTSIRISEGMELTQEIYIDDSLVDTKIIDDSYINLSSGGIGVGAIGTYAIGDDGLEDTEDDDLQEVLIKRSRGNLNIKGKSIYFRYTTSSQIGKVRLDDITVRVELKPTIAVSQGRNSGVGYDSIGNTLIVY